MRGNARSVRVALLTDELMKLKGRGCGRPQAPQLLAKMSVLRQLALAQVPKDPKDKLTPNGEGEVIRDYIWEKIKSFPDGMYTFGGKVYPASIMKKAFRIELALGFEGDHPARICRLMLLLDRWDSWETWRKGPERQLLAILAEHMIRTEHGQAA